MRQMADNMQEARVIWGKYFMLTNELLKLINRQDIDNFIELVDQREKLLKMAEALPDTEYRKSEECKALFEKIKPIDMQLIYKAKSWLNKSRRNNMAVRSYDLTGGNSLGVMLNKKL